MNVEQDTVEIVKYINLIEKLFDITKLFDAIYSTLEYPVDKKWKKLENQSSEFP